MRQPLSSILWPEDKVNALRELIAEKLTSGQIAKSLNVTRNAVIGKIHRLGLILISDEARKVRRPSAARKAPTKFVVTNGQEIPMEPSKPKPAEPMRKLSLFELEESSCRFPLEDRGEYDIRLFCGREVAKSSSYCAQHHRKTHYWR